jgi:predicted nuclease with TOPRIM domain
LGADIERARQALFEDARRKLGEATVEMAKREAEFQSGLRQERVQLTVALDSLRDEVAALHSRLDELERELLTGGDMGQDLPDPLEPAKPIASMRTR